MNGVKRSLWKLFSRSDIGGARAITLYNTHELACATYVHSELTLNIMADKLAEEIFCRERISYL